MRGQFLLLLILVTVGCFAENNLEDHKSDNVILCEIEGKLGKSDQRLDGNLVNCRSSGPKCSIDLNDGFNTTKKNVKCRESNGNMFWEVEKHCSFRVHYKRRAVCISETSDCSNILFTCSSITTFKPIFFISIGIIVGSSLLAFLLHYIYQYCYRVENYTLPQT
ncbi:hypothetical protein GCK72_022333 [Caenorhabditis remanei]|uniref:SRCR domain-containing protein n=1 Tax=Caenorhabditis remanei TaxID=31234 RepID=A0A6A5FTS3_CAERE|nr:hypothetical protein GCK72_022333 [Caenorhabditis remanei]KAF1745886.1 hypothetical protein GCK72_022333 [Caenorhabditis remanei]